MYYTKDNNEKVLLSSLLCASMMFAANSEYKYEITPMIGGTYAEGNLDLDQNYGVGGLSLGFNLDESMFDQVEIGILNSLKDVEYKNSTKDVTITRTFANLVKDYKLNDSISLYALAGAGVEWFSNKLSTNETSPFVDYGVGIKYALNETMSLKADIRHLIETDNGDNNLLYTVGLAIPFGKKAAPAPVIVEKPVIKSEPKDSDNDGIIDEEDQCPNSAIGAKVNSKGCEIDSDGDGVVDSKDKCPNTPKGDIVDENGCSLKVNLNINFATDSAIINNSYDSKIKKFADFLKAFPTVKGKIEAHTDSDGSEEYNQKLSEKRAAAAVKALEAYGVDSSRVSATGYGETKPVASNDTAEGKAANRRVEGFIQQ